MSTATSYDPFLQTVPANDGGGDFERPDPGTYPAMLIGVVDMGTHSRTYNGKTTEQRKIYLAWELTAENDSKGNTFVVGQDYTWSFNTKAHYRSLVEGWTGKTLVEGQAFDIRTLVGKPCVIGISEGLSAAGKKFSEISSVGPVMKGLVVPEATRQPFVFSVSSVQSPDLMPEFPGWLPRLYGRLIIDDVKASKEFQAMLAKQDIPF